MDENEPEGVEERRRRGARYTKQFPCVITEAMNEAVLAYATEQGGIAKAEVVRRALDRMFPDAARGYEDH